MIAHRGLKLFENKVIYFPPVSKLKCVRGIEFDVHENSKKQIVITHDHIDRNKLDNDLLSNFPKFEHTKLVVDIKTHNNEVFMAQETVNNLSDLFEEHDWELCSFDKRCVQELIKLKGDGDNFEVGYIHNGFLGFPGSELDINFISLYWENIKPRTIEWYHNRGIRVYAWTVPNVKEAERLKEMGVDEIIIDV